MGRTTSKGNEAKSNMKHLSHMSTPRFKCSGNSKDNVGVVKINRLITDNIYSRQFITYHYNNKEEVIFQMSYLSNILLLVYSELDNYEFFKFFFNVSSVLLSLISIDSAFQRLGAA